MAKYIFAMNVHKIIFPYTSIQNLGQEMGHFYSPLHTVTEANPCKYQVRMWAFFNTTR